MTDTPRPRIGDFRPTKNSLEPRTKEQTPEAAAAEVTATKAVEKANSDNAAAAPKTPRELYLERLKEAGILLSDAQHVYDVILSGKVYEERVSLGSDRFVVLGTRQYDDHQRLQDTLEQVQPRMLITQDDLVTRYNLAASLREWQGVRYPHVTEEDFLAAFKVVKSMSGPLFNLMAQKIAKFDQKILTIFSEGCTEAF